ncbi:MAG: hypothetical protein AAF787_11765 [Chloroflexota bacterium]
MRNLPDANDLKQQINLRTVVQQMWGQPKFSSARYDVYRSRWRYDGKKPSFTVYATHFKDYGGDGASGDLYEFLQQELNISFRQALEWAATYTGNVPRSQREPVPAPTSTSEPPSAQWQGAARKVLAWTQKYLWSDRPDAQKALDYLRTVRGLSDETIRRAGYGYAPRWLPTDYRDRLTKRQVRLAPGIIEPWACDGALWALRVRCRVGNLARHLGTPDDTLGKGTSPKYLNLTGSRQSGALYNGDAVIEGGDVLVVEGGFDARLAEQVLTPGRPAGSPLQTDDSGRGESSTRPATAVVTFGSATNHPTGRRLAQLKTAGRVFLLLDDDEAGESARDKLTQALGEKAHVITLPQGNDVTEFVVNHRGDMRTVLFNAERAARGMSAAWWAGTLPDGVRQILLNYFRPVTAPVIEMVNTAVNRGLIDSECFTVNDLLAANEETGFNISAGSVRRVLNELDGYFFAESDTNKIIKIPVSNGENKCRGRKSKALRLLSLDVVKQSLFDWALPRIIEKHYPTTGDEAAIAPFTVAMFEAADFTPREADTLTKHLQETCGHLTDNPMLRQKAMRELASVRAKINGAHSTPLPQGWPLANGSEYRAAFLRVTNDESLRRSRREIRELIGVSNGSVDNMVRRAGLERREKDGEFETVAIKHPQHIEQQVTQGARKVAGYPRTVIVNHESGETQRVAYRGEETAEWVQMRMAEGAAVSVQYQVANHYVEVSEIPPEEPKRTPSTEQPKVRIPQRRAAPKKVWGPWHDPQWAAAQVMLLLEKRGLIHVNPSTGTVTDVKTGEIIAHPTPRALLARWVPKGVIAREQRLPFTLSG